MFSFKLSDSFVESYRDRPVPWGYKDAGGNSMGEITFLRTYSRKKEDGTKERWYEVCRRVVEGMFSIQRDYVMANRLPWNQRKAQRAAQDAFERMFVFKWTPPGRGLWMMGTPLVMEQRNSAALQNCFTADTRFITNEGVMTLGEAVGTTVAVWAEGEWTKATVEHFGRQPVQRITFAPFGARSNLRVVETATPNHRWQLRDGSTTTSLQVGDVVPAAAVQHPVDDDVPSEALIHGMVFADGSLDYEYVNGWEKRYSLRLCGDKAQHVDLFDDVKYHPSYNGDPTAYVSSGVDLKALPLQREPSYVRDFIEGWARLDGERVSNGYIVSTQDAAAVEWLKEHAALGGFVVTGHSTESNLQTNFGPRSAPLHKVTIKQVDGRHWTVKSIEVLDEEVDVYCAVVPGVERFTLASGIYTSNCAFVSTADMTAENPAEPFAFLMEASMLGVGVGFDTLGAGKFVIHEPAEAAEPYVYEIPDSREGWVESLEILLNSYLFPNRYAVTFDYSLIRPAGAPIKTFGGTAAGHEPLKKLHDGIRRIFAGRAGDLVDSADLADIGNLIGVCVVSGNVRRSAELLQGSINDPNFLDLKNYGTWDQDINGLNGPAAYRAEWGWMSNNSVAVNVGEDLDPIIEGIARNGEPGVIWLDLSRKYGRLIDPPNNKDWRIAGYNPCAEQSLESYEMCTLVETYIGNHDSLDDFQRTLKVAYLYGKTVTLLPTHWEKTNAIMQRNRRIGTSISGIANFADNHGMMLLRTWMDEGYRTVQKYDRLYSEWLCVRESIKTTTVKPSGTVSILAGESPGVHWAPGGEYFDRGIVFNKEDPLVLLLQNAGYKVYESAYTPETSVFVQFPIRSRAKRSEKDVSLYEKANLAVLAQRYWSDNSVSVTLSFDADKEFDHVGRVLHMHEGQLKTVSFLPQGNATYAQMPYQESTPEAHEAAEWQLLPLDLTGIYEGLGWDAIGEAYCTTGACELQTIKNETEKQGQGA